MISGVDFCPPQAHTCSPAHKLTYTCTHTHIHNLKHCFLPLMRLMFECEIPPPQTSNPSASASPHARIIGLGDHTWRRLFNQQNRSTYSQRKNDISYVFNKFIRRQILSQMLTAVELPESLYKRIKGVEMPGNSGVSSRFNVTSPHKDQRLLPRL